jgi:hypothetical protein
MHVRLTSSLAFAPDSPEEVEAGALESQVLLLSAAVRQDPVEALFRAFRTTDERFIKKAKREVRLSVLILLKSF